MYIIRDYSEFHNYAIVDSANNRFYKVFDKHVAE